MISELKKAFFEADAGFSMTIFDVTIDSSPQILVLIFRSKDGCNQGLWVVMQTNDRG